MLRRVTIIVDYDGDEPTPEDWKYLIERGTSEWDKNSEAPVVDVFDIKVR